jgi:hypothetical protein
MFWPFVRLVLLATSIVFEVVFALLLFGVIISLIK